MPIADALVAVLASPHALDNFRSHLDPEWIEQSVARHGHVDDPQATVAL